MVDIICRRKGGNFFRFWRILPSMRHSKPSLILVLALLALVLFLRPYLAIIAVSGLLAFLMLPVFERLQSGRFKMSANSAAAVSLGLSAVLITVPAALIVWAAVNQGQDLVSQLRLDQVSLGDSNVDGFTSQAADRINQLAESVAGIDNAFSQEQIHNFVQESLPKITDTLVDLLVSIVRGIPNFIVSIILFMYVFLAFLIYRRQIMKFVYAASPFSLAETRKMIARLKSMAKGMVIGQGVIALCQGLVSAASLSLIGLGGYFFVFFIFLTFLSLIPLGAGIITIPIGLTAILAGSTWQGVVILLTHFLIVTNIDNVLRPMLVPKGAKLPAALVLLAAFAGVYYFGFLGVIYGPVLMILIVSVLETYVRSAHSTSSAS